MADPRTVTTQQVSEIERLLGYLENRFAELEDIAKEWDGLSPQDKNDFLFDWAVVEDALADLQVRVQRAPPLAPRDLRYRQLSERAARDRPLLLRLRRT